MRNKVGNSRFWNILWEKYENSPSIAFCRVPELEYGSTLNLEGNVLDHCCGDGVFASLAWPDKKLLAGCDIDQNSIKRAEGTGIYARLDICDVSKRLPYDDEKFDLVFNNSGLEHILDLDVALAEVARVISRNGTFAFNVLNHRYFEWWPLTEKTAENYRVWQPFFHAFNLSEWSKRLMDAGLKVTSVEGYFDKQASRELALLDYTFSSVCLGRKRNSLVWAYTHIPYVVRRYWRKRLSQLTWRSEPDSGSGYFIRASRINA